MKIGKRLLQDGIYYLQRMLKAVRENSALKSTSTCLHSTPNILPHEGKPTAASANDVYNVRGPFELLHEQLDRPQNANEIKRKGFIKSKSAEKITLNKTETGNQRLDTYVFRPTSNS